MATLQAITVGLLEVFHRYSEKEGNKYTLTKAELKTLLQSELDELISSCKDPAAVDKLMTSLDLNQDGEVDFQEFMLMFAVLVMACHEFFKDYKKSKEQNRDQPCTK